MKTYSLRFNADPANDNAPWSGREGAEVKMLQSIKDYLTERCGCSGVELATVAPKVEVPQHKPTPEPVRRGFKKKR